MWCSVRDRPARGEGTTTLACLGLDRTQFPSHSIVIMWRESHVRFREAGKCMRVIPRIEPQLQCITIANPLATA